MSNSDLMSSVPDFDLSEQKDSRWEHPEEQVMLLETAKRLFVNETKEIPEFAKLWSEDDRALAVSYLLDIHDHIRGLLLSLSRRNSK